MKEYKIERIEGRGFIGVNFDEYQTVIEEYAKKGYRFITWIPAKIIGYGKICEIDLVFEKDL